MTFKKLITYCTTRDGNCDKCIYARYCETYKKMYDTIPLDEDEIHPERFTRQEIKPTKELENVG